MNGVREQMPRGHLKKGSPRRRAQQGRHAVRTRGAAGSRGWSGASKDWGDGACGQGGARSGSSAEGMDFILNDMTTFDWSDRGSRFGSKENGL